MSFRCLLLFLVGLTLLIGCTTPPKPPAEDPTIERLRKIGLAYLQVNNTSGRAPQNAEELEAALKQMGESDPASLFVSAIDNEPFVIIWNVEAERLTSSQENFAAPTIIAYEKTGKDGIRHAVTAQCFVAALNKDEFAKANFPRGHEPPR